MNKNKILKKVVSEISLGSEELASLNKQVLEITKKIKKNLKDEKIILGGSLAKKTLIKKDGQDIDLFVIFKDEDSTKNLAEILKKSKIDVKVIHGSRDYFHYTLGKITFEFIPIVKLTKDKANKNVTDFSPLHVDYISGRIKKNSSLAGEIRLAKSFCMAGEIYGAESYIGGFSGYALELLVCHFGGFKKFLKGIQKEDYIDPEKHFKNKKEAFREINGSKLLSPLVLIDPTYKYRNVCAGLTSESFAEIRSLAKDFLKNPSEDFFKIVSFDQQYFLDNSKKEKTTSLIINLKTNRENKDIAGTKMKKFAKFLINQLERKQQEVKDFKFVYSGEKTAKLFLAIKLKDTVEIRGPEKTKEKALSEFKKSRKEIYFSKGFAFAKEKFKLKDFLKKESIVARQMDVEVDLKNLKICF